MSSHFQMTATAANARLLGRDEGPSNAWRTALALRADAQQSRPSIQKPSVLPRVH